MPVMDKATINRALRPLGLEIQNQRGAGYSYFTSRRHGHQVGESVYYSYLSSVPVARWVLEARAALCQHRKEGVALAYCLRQAARRQSKSTPSPTP